MKYTGKLAKPITRPRHRLLLAEAMLGKTDLAERPYQERLGKIPELFEAHGIPAGNWQALVLALATEHVPGFKIVNPAGRKTEWSALEKAEFRLDVDSLIKAKPGTAVTTAIGRAAKLERWLEKTQNMKVAALSQHYYRADSRLVVIAQKARAYESLVQND